MIPASQVEKSCQALKGDHPIWMGTLLAVALLLGREPLFFPPTAFHPHIFYLVLRCESARLHSYLYLGYEDQWFVHIQVVKE